MWAWVLHEDAPYGRNRTFLAVPSKQAEAHFLWLLIGFKLPLFSGKAAPMISRYAGSCLGLLAFMITVSAGMAVGNPFGVTMSRAIWALLVFCALGMVLGACAQSVVHEHHHHNESIANAASLAEDEGISQALAGTADDDGEEFEIAELAQPAAGPGPLDSLGSDS